MYIKVEKINFSYTKGIPVIKAMSLEIENESIAIIGQNGSGKTTFIRLLNGILQVDNGNILINGENIQSRPLYQWASTIAYVFQNPNDQLFQETVYKELVFSVKQKEKDKGKQKEIVQRIAETVGLENDLTKHPAEMPFSKKKIVTLASVLGLDPDIILLDEPTASQDWAEIEKFENIIKNLEKQGKYFITISHDMDFVARNFNRVLVFNQGEILLDGTAREVFRQEEKCKISYVIAPVASRCSNILNLETTALTAEEFLEMVK